MSRVSGFISVIRPVNNSATISYSRQAKLGQTSALLSLILSGVGSGLQHGSHDVLQVLILLTLLHMLMLLC